MEQAQDNRLPYILVNLGKLVFAFGLAKIVYVTSTKPNITQLSDFLCTFYTAGHLVASGHARDLYLPAGSTSYYHSAFSQAAVALLPHAPRDLASIWMYSPLNALIFAPFSLLPPELALSAWQLLSFLALIFVCALLAGTTTKYRGFHFLWISFLFAPIYQAIYMGQMAIQFGLLPLVAGYWLLLRRRDFWAGLALSATTLNPKYLPIALLVSLVLMFRRRNLSLVGLTSGVILFVTANYLVFPSDVFNSWITSVRSAENAFYDPLLVPPAKHLMASLPATILISIPPDFMLPAKILVYALAAVIGLFTVWRCWKLARSSNDDALVTSASFMILSFATLLLEPHLLFYDLSALFLSSIIIVSREWPETNRMQLLILTAMVWIAIDVDYLLYTYTAIRPHPFILIAVLVEILRRLLLTMKRMEAPSL